MLYLRLSPSPILTVPLAAVCLAHADRHKLTPKNINNTQYVACMNPTAGSFVINPRLQRLFMTLAVDFPGQDSLMKIYGTFLQVRHAGAAAAASAFNKDVVGVLCA